MSYETPARRTDFSIAVDGVNVTKKLRPFFLNMQYTDAAESEADDLKITLQDRDGIWAGGWLGDMLQAASGRGVKIKAALVQRGWEKDYDRWLDCGVFELDSVEASGPSTAVVLQASALPYSGAVRQTKKTRSWESYSLTGIAQEIAANNGMKCGLYAAANPVYDRLEQRRQTDTEFLSRLCQDAAVSLKITNNTLVLFDQRSFEKQPPVRTIRKGGGYVSYRFMASTAGTQYDSCRVSYTEPATGKVVEGTAKSEDYDESSKNHKQLEITAKTATPGEAKTLAENHLRMHNKFARTATFTLPGDPLLLAGQTVQVEGWAALDVYQQSPYGAYGPKSNGWDANGSKSNDKNSDGTYSQGTKSNGTKSYGKETNGTDSYGALSYGTKSYGKNSDGNEIDVGNSNTSHNN